MTESKEQTNKLNPPEKEQQESSPSVLNRRQFIVAGAAAAAALVLPKSAQAYVEMPGMRKKTGGVAQNFSVSTATPLTSPSDTSFYQPNIIASAVNAGDNYGTLSSTLEIAQEPYPTGSTTYIRMLKEVKQQKAPFRFEPGPTFCVNPGDKFDLNVTNNLPVDIVPPPAGSTGVESTYCLPTPGNTPGCFNTTNLHFHGLHVSPLSVDTSGNPISAGNATSMVQIKESSDDVLFALAPNGGSNKYCPWLPAFHAPGTHWYHAHHHGSTGLQVASGLAGALIVEEPPGQEVCKGAPDIVMIMQEKPQALNNSNLTAQENLDRGVYERTGGQAGTFLINGKQNPTLNLKQGEIQRWRFINATSTPRAFTLLQLQDNTGNPVAWYRIAVDGITLYGKQMNDPSVLFGAGTTANGVAAVASVPFAPGNRVDMLVNLPPGNYKLQKLADGTSAGASGTQLLATIVVSNQPYIKQAEVQASFFKLMDTKGGGIPSTGKPAYLNPITTVDNNNQTPVVFQASGAPPANSVTTAGKGNFRISNTKFSPQNLANVQANLNTTEEWIVANALGNAAHPFHIHVNPFLVVATADITNSGITTSDTPQQMYQKLQNATWTDTSFANNGIDPTIWWDTFTIPKQTAFKIRHRFDDYWGNYVLHCHILLHEDQGMMWTVQINDPDGKGANPCQQLLTPIT